MQVCSYDRSGLGFSDRAYQVIQAAQPTCIHLCMYLTICMQNTSKYTNDYGEGTRERDRTLPSTVERFLKALSYKMNC